MSDEHDHAPQRGEQQFGTGVQRPDDIYDKLAGVRDPGYER
jgi:hypothetical protein